MATCSLNYLVTREGYLNDLRTLINFERKNYWQSLLSGKWQSWRRSAQIIKNLKKELHKAKKQLLEEKIAEGLSQEIIEGELIDEEKADKTTIHV